MSKQGLFLSSSKALPVREGSLWLPNIMPIFRRDEKEDLGTCRPVSVTSCVGKLFEVTFPQSHLQEPEGKEGDREQPVLDLQGQIMPDQPDCLQWWDDWLRGESAVFNVFLVVRMMTWNTPPKFLEKTESDSSHTCSVKGWEAADTNCSLFNITPIEIIDGTDTLPREAEGPSTLEVIKTHLNKARSNLL